MKSDGYAVQAKVKGQPKKSWKRVWENDFDKAVELFNRLKSEPNVFAVGMFDQTGNVVRYERVD